MHSPLSYQSSIQALPTEDTLHFHAPLYFKEKGRQTRYLSQVYLLPEDVELAWHYVDPLTQHDLCMTGDLLLYKMQDTHGQEAIDGFKQNQQQLILRLCRTIEQNPDAETCGFFTDPEQILAHFIEQAHKMPVLHDKDFGPYWERRTQPHLAVLPAMPWVKQSGQGNGVRQTEANTILICN